MSRIKVAQMTLSMGQGGIENLILSMARHMDQERFETSVYCLDFGGELLGVVRQLGVSTHVFSRKPGFDLKLIWRLARSLRKEGIQILHTHNQAAHFYGALAARIARVPVVINTEHSRHNTDGAWRRRLEKRVLSLISDRLVTVSDELKQSSVERDGISADKIQVVCNGIDIERFSSIPEAALLTTRAALGLPSTARVVSIVARLHPIKNHALLLEAITKVRQSMPEVHLLIIGDGELRAELESLAARLDLKTTVTFLGNRLDVPELLKISDLLILCSKSEGLPLVLLEAMAAEVPILVTDGANRSGLIRHMENGLVSMLDPEILVENIVWCLDQRQRLAGLAASAKVEVTQRFSIAQAIGAYQGIYQRYFPIADVSSTQSKGLLNV